VVGGEPACSRWAFDKVIAHAKKPGITRGWAASTRWRWAPYSNVLDMTCAYAAVITAACFVHHPVR